MYGQFHNDNNRAANIQKNKPPGKCGRFIFLYVNKIILLSVMLLHNLDEVDYLV